MPTLLGHLAQFASLSSQGEFLCTQGLPHLLGEHADASAALATELTARTGVDLPHDLTWLAEPPQSDGGRPDLEARLGAIPIVKIEAKLDAAFSQANSSRTSWISRRDCCRSSAKACSSSWSRPPAPTRRLQS